MNQDNLEDKIKEAKNAEDSENFFVASAYYKDALILAAKNQDSKLIKLCKNKIVEMNKKSIASGKDFKIVEEKIEPSDKEQEVIKAFIDRILSSKNVSTVLKIIGQHPFLYPKEKEVEEQSRKTMPISHQLTTLSTISTQGHDLRGGSDGNYSWFMSMYDISQRLIMNMYLDRLMYQFIHDKTLKNKLTIKKLADYFSQSGIINPKRLGIILVGLQKYFKEDYISSLHILVPQFEGLFLEIAQHCGIDIVALDQKQGAISTRTKALSEYYLESEEFKKIFGEDFCRQLKFVLFEQMGYRLRHKIAHGEIAPEECNFPNATLIIYFYLVLLARVSTTAEK